MVGAAKMAGVNALQGIQASRVTNAWRGLSGPSAQRGALRRRAVGDMVGVWRTGDANATRVSVGTIATSVRRDL